MLKRKCMNKNSWTTLKPPNKFVRKWLNDSWTSSNVANKSDSKKSIVVSNSVSKTVTYQFLFLLATDDLRKEAGKFFVHQCQMEREKQLMDKKKAIDQKIMEEQVYAQLWALDLQAKEQRERQEAEEKKKRIGDTMAVLDWQKETRQQNKQQEKQMTEQERKMLREQWIREQEAEQEIDRQKLILNRERNLELIRHNEAEKVLRDEQMKTEKERDREML